MHKFSYFILSLLLTTAILLSGCGQTADTDNTAKQDGKFHIVTSFYPVYIMAANITQGIEGVELTNMTQPQTGCLHDYQLTTKDMKVLEQADAFIINGAGMEAFLDKALSARDGLIIIDSSKDIPLLEIEGEENPHIWLDIDNNIQQVKNIAQQLAAADPAHGEAYKANAAKYIDKLEALKQEMHQQLDNLPQRDIVTFHEAFPYFAQEFNLHIVKVIEREPGTEPSPKELEETIAEINKLPQKVLFTEPQYSSAAAETISRETGAKIYTLDPIVTGEATPEAADAYINTMQANGKTLQESLQ